MFLAFFSRCLCFQVTVMEKDHQNICLLIQLLWNCLLHHSLQSLLRECLHSPYFPICQFALLKTCLRKLDELLFIGSISKELILLRSNFYRNIMNVDIKCHYSLCRPVRMLSVFCWKFIFISIKDDNSAKAAEVCKCILEALIEDVTISDVNIRANLLGKFPALKNCQGGHSFFPLLSQTPLYISFNWSILALIIIIYSTCRKSRGFRAAFFVKTHINVKCKVVYDTKENFVKNFWLTGKTNFSVFWYRHARHIINSHQLKRNCQMHSLS